MHGFLNVFTAACALEAGVIDARHVAHVIAEEDPRAFSLDERHLAWNAFALDPEAIAAGRRRATSFGSCSFDEPVADLRALGMLA